MGVEGVLTPWEYIGGVRVCFDSLKCHILSFTTVVGYRCKFHAIDDEKLVSKMEANF